jgi:uncharacterized protein DUF3224
MKFEAISMEHQLKARLRILNANESPSCTLESGTILFQSRVREEFLGDIVGEGDISHLLIREVHGYSYFAGFEEIKCKIREFSGGFIMRETGVFGRNMLAIDCVIIEGSGFGDLATISGTARIEMDKNGPHISMACRCEGFDR